MKENNFRPTGAHSGASAHHLTSPPHRILVVDDETAIRRMITAALARSGYCVDAAEDGAVAWEALQAQPYDLLITDHAMPKITGIELVKALRSARMALPVVMVARRLPAYEMARKPSLQLAATLLKPFQVGELLDTVENVLRATASSREQINPPPNWKNQLTFDGFNL